MALPASNRYFSGSQSQIRKPSVASSTSSTSDSKRKVNQVILLSSDEEDDDVTEVRPRKRQLNNPPSNSLQPYTHRQKGKLSSGSSASTNTSSSPQRLLAVEVPLRQADAQRKRFLLNLSILHGPSVTVVNEIDETSPSIDFRFVSESILGNGVEKATEEFMVGCTCRRDSRDVGCEYLYCECLDDSAVNDDGKRVFPYSAAKKNRGCLRDFYLESRHHIYECNPHCNCTNCKNRNVQKGRQIQLEIFKTQNRGWGKRYQTNKASTLFRLLLILRYRSSLSSSLA